MSSRFSLRMVRILRLAVVGILGVIVMAAVSCTVRLAVGAGFLQAAAFALLPYLFTTFFCMLLLRKWHSENNIFGCAAIAVGVSIAMLCGFSLPDPLLLLRQGLPVLLPICVLLTAAEAYRYLKESEELQCSFC